MATPPTIPDPTKLPAVMTDADLGVALHTTSSGARRIRLREGIPFSRVGRRALVRRAAFFAWLEARETASGQPQDPPQVPKIPPWARDVLRRRRRAEGRLGSLPPRDSV